MSDGAGEFGLLLKPSATVLVVLDYQDDLLNTLPVATRDELAVSALALGKIAKACSVPVLFSSLASEAFHGQTWPPLRDLFPKAPEVRREHINCWDDPGFAGEVRALKKDRLLLAGLWTEAAITFAALSGLELGYQVYVVTDAVAGMTASSHEVAVDRMVQSGVVPVTWRQVLFEWYRVAGPQDGPVSQALLAIAREHGLGLGQPFSNND